MLRRLFSWPTARREVHPLVRPLHLEFLEGRRLLAARAAAAVNQFGFDLYEHLQREKGNLVFSPLSISTTLAMAYAGAAEQTAAEMQQVLHFGESPGIHESFRELASAIEGHTNDATGYVVDLANSLWPILRDPDPAYRTLIETNYDAYVEDLSGLPTNQINDRINAWVSDETRGLIDDFLDEVSPEISAILVNTTYFKGLWNYPFDPQYTRAGHFQLANGDLAPIPYMYNQAFLVAQTFPEYGGLTALELPIAGGHASMYFVVAPEGSANLITTSQLAAISEWFEGPTDGLAAEIGVTIPQFQVDVHTNLEQVLQGMGMPSAFSEGFPLISGDPIQKVGHEVALKVTEMGTEFAAATEVQFGICFAAGTPVLTPTGETPIEQLRVGDLVLSRGECEVEGQPKPKAVEELIRGHAAILELHVQGHRLRTTCLHPFFAQARGWITAGELEPGDLLCTDGGGWVAVDRIESTSDSEPVYNLVVADHHTYFVGHRAWGFALWAHNGCGPSKYISLNRPFHFFIKEHDLSTILLMGRIEDPSQTAKANLTPQVIAASADFNLDQRVDGHDFLHWQRGFGLPANASLADGDADADGAVTSRDREIWAAQWGSGNSPTLQAISRDFAISRRQGFREFLPEHSPNSAKPHANSPQTVRSAAAGPLDAIADARVGVRDRLDPLLTQVFEELGGDE